MTLTTNFFLQTEKDTISHLATEFTSLLDLKRSGRFSSQNYLTVYTPISNGSHIFPVRLSLVNDAVNCDISHPKVCYNDP